jgi:very-short-patch-repair endonuclease
MRLCPFCDRVVGNDPHIYSCKNKKTDDRIEIKFQFIKKNFPEISEKNTLYRIYLEESKSLVDIKTLYGIDFKSTIFLLDYFNIPKRSISESALKISRHKYKKTCLEKHGVDNVSKKEEFKIKKKNTFLENYGVDNIFKDTNFKKWILENNFAWKNLSKEENESRVKKQTESMKKYWQHLTDEQKNKLFSYGGTSNLETMISNSLNDLSIGYTTQFLLKGKLFDFRINNTNILLEINGDYWHCNPEKYDINETIKFPGRISKVSDIWKKDDIKREMAESNGYKVIYIWESEIKNTDNIIQLILSKLNI